MSKPRGIIIFGANGSGKTTLGRELACILDCCTSDFRYETVADTLDCIVG